MTLRTVISCWIGGLSIIVVIIATAIGYGMGIAPKSEQHFIIYLTAELLLIIVSLSLAVLAGKLIAIRIKEMIAKESAAMQAERSQEEEARNQLISDAAHELRTPVTILRGHMETMLAGAQEMNRESLLPLLDETKRMTRLIQELQQLNLAEAGRLTLDRSWISFQVLLNEVLDIFSAEAEEKNMELQYIGANHSEVYCDPIRIKQVLINLIGNAIRYASEKGKVCVRCENMENGYIRVEIEDDGPGIPHDNLPYLFHRFYRVDNSRNRSVGGTGLGLAIAKQFVEAHGGILSVSSEIGVGTVFVIQLPMFPDL